MSAELVHYTVSDAIAQITLDRAPVNALSMPLIDALLEALEKAKDDASVRAVIICSAHKVFCAGLDLDIVRHDHCRRSRNVRLSGNRCRTDPGPAFCAIAAPCREASGIRPAVSGR